MIELTGDIALALGIARGILERGAIVGTGEYKPPKLGGSFKGATVGTSPAFGCSAQVAEVTVDLETGEVTPSGWEPGQKTLTPGPDLVGKVWKVWKP